MTLFPNFLHELETHRALGYHSDLRKESPRRISEEASLRSWRLPSDYVDFLTAIGSGRFFGGSLTIYSFASLISTTDQLRAFGVMDRLAFGYDGTTEGCFCISNEGEDGVHWIRWTDGHDSLEDPQFASWVEGLPSKLYNESAYKAYRKIRDPEGVANVIRARRAFTVRLISFDPKLSRPPEKKSDLLARYNKLTFEVAHIGNDELERITVRCKRRGSKVGDDNVEYVSLPVFDIRVGERRIIEGFLFDPFNVPFESIVAEYEPEIDLTAPTKAKYVELRPFI